MMMLWDWLASRRQKYKERLILVQNQIQQQPATVSQQSPTAGTSSASPLAVSVAVVPTTVAEAAVFVPQEPETSTTLILNHSATVAHTVVELMAANKGEADEGANFTSTSFYCSRRCSAVLVSAATVDEGGGDDDGDPVEPVDPSPHRLSVTSATTVLPPPVRSSSATTTPSWALSSAGGNGSGGGYQRIALVNRNAVLLRRHSTSTSLLLHGGPSTAVASTSTGSSTASIYPPLGSINLSAINLSGSSRRVLAQQRRRATEAEYSSWSRTEQRSRRQPFK